MEPRILWAILSLIASILIYIIFKPTERNVVLDTVIDTHAHRTHYFFADPRCLSRMYPDVVETTRLIDGRVDGRGEEAVEVYDVAVNTHFKMLGFHNFTTILTADVHNRRSFNHISYIHNLMYLNILWEVTESGDDRMKSGIHQQVTVCLPHLFWVFVSEQLETQFHDLLSEGLRKAEAHLLSNDF